MRDVKFKYQVARCEIKASDFALQYHKKAFALHAALIRRSEI